MEDKDKKRLAQIMVQAISGDEETISEVIELFKGRIKKRSYYNGQYREDIRIEIIEKLYRDIPKFTGLEK